MGQLTRGFNSFIVCNNGYTVERLIHGEKQIYNDIQPWNHRLLPALFGATPGTYQTHRVGTTAELEALWRCENFTDCSVLQVSKRVTAPKDQRDLTAHSLSNCASPKMMRHLTWSR